MFGTFPDGDAYGPGDDPGLDHRALWAALAEMGRCDDDEGDDGYDPWSCDPEDEGEADEAERN